MPVKEEEEGYILAAENILRPENSYNKLYWNHVTTYSASKYYMYVQTSSTQPNLMSRFRLGTSFPLSPSAPSGRLQGDLYLQNSIILQSTLIRLRITSYTMGK